VSHVAQYRFVLHDQDRFFAARRHGFWKLRRRFWLVWLQCWLAKTRECGTLPTSLATSKPAFVLLYNAINRRQAQARAFPYFLGCEKGLEYAAHRLAVHSAAPCRKPAGKTKLPGRASG